MSNEKLDVTVLLMCLNEQEALPKVVGDIRAAFEAKKYSYEILVVDDGSTDQTASIAQSLSCRVVHHAVQRGAGAAYKTGVLSAQGAIIVILDADGTYTASDIPKMLEYFPEFDQVNGARTSEKGDMPFLRAPVKWLVRVFVCLLARKNIPDLQTGLKAFKRDVMLPYLWVIPDKFSYATLTTLAFLCHGHPVKYIPTEYHKRIGQSKFHPIKDTAYVLMSVCRFFIHFFPSRIFFPIAIIAIPCLGAIVYSNTFNCSFHFDDHVFITNNYLIRSIHHLLTYWKFYPCRFITFLSLTINYHFNGLNVFGYHFFNLGVHLVSSLLVWWLTLLTFSTPAMKENKITRHSNLIALFAGLVFVSHPVQTEAVTYIWQRTSSMAAMFYVASLCLYVKSRLHTGSSLGRFCYIFSLLMAIVAMFTKENAVTLPLMILLYEFYFFEVGAGLKPSPTGLNWRYLFPFLLTLFIIPLTILFAKAPQLQAIQKFEETGGTSPWDYLLTQFRVIVTYIRLIFLPLNQNIDYDYPISKSIFELPTLMCFLFLAGIFIFAKQLFLKYRLISFSICWFFLTLSLESSLFPLKNVIFEHRLYLPLVGYSMFLVSGVYYLFGKESIKTMVIILTVIITFNSILTFQRNKVWKNEVTLWDDAVRKSPHKARPVNDRAFAYYDQGKFLQAIADYNKAIEIDPNLADAYAGRGLTYADQGKFPQAIADYNKAIELEPAFAEVYINRGILYPHQGGLTQAISDLTKAIDIDPMDAKAYYNRGLTYGKQGNFIQAIADYNKAIEIDTGYADAYYNQGLVFAQQEYYPEAVFDFKRTIAINPNYADAYNNLGIVYAIQDNFTQAILEFNQAIKINSNDTAAYNNIVKVYYQLGKYDKAWENAHKAEELGAVIDPQLIAALKAASVRDK